MFNQSNYKSQKKKEKKSEDYIKIMSKVQEGEELNLDIDPWI